MENDRSVANVDKDSHVCDGKLERLRLVDDPPVSFSRSTSDEDCGSSIIDQQHTSGILALDYLRFCSYDWSTHYSLTG
jgi:hypothetical protein